MRSNGLAPDDEPTIKVISFIYFLFDRYAAGKAPTAEQFEAAWKDYNTHIQSHDSKERPRT